MEILISASSGCNRSRKFIVARQQAACLPEQAKHREKRFRHRRKTCGTCYGLKALNGTGVKSPRPQKNCNHLIESPQPAFCCRLQLRADGANSSRIHSKQPSAAAGRNVLSFVVHGPFSWRYGISRSFAAFDAISTTQLASPLPAASSSPCGSRHSEGETTIHSTFSRRARSVTL
jgi:hypothetical protein